MTAGDGPAAAVDAADAAVVAPVADASAVSAAPAAVLAAAFSADVPDVASFAFLAAAAPAAAPAAAADSAPRLLLRLPLPLLMPLLLLLPRLPQLLLAGSCLDSSGTLPGLFRNTSGNEPTHSKTVRPPAPLPCLAPSSPWGPAGLLGHLLHSPCESVTQPQGDL